MKGMRKSALVAILMIVAAASMAFAQGPMQKRINYTINVSHTMRMGDYLMSPGRYVLYQISQNDLTLFALYRNDTTHSPVAMIRTTRIEYQSGDYPSKTNMILDIDESSSDLHPVIRGWNIPGEDGWEIVSVVAKDDKVLTRIK
ncbi:MAG TPA: hypothetical protein VLR90_03240 [Blastocatellia bacterium]|nr:hypothetical protein [Blastocatellia bacterium]